MKAPIMKFGTDEKQKDGGSIEERKKIVPGSISSVSVP
jgi:hypothetical protein